MADFGAAIEFVLANEGGYEPPSPMDPGGETNFGISKRQYPEEDIRNMTRDRAKFLYERDFWRFEGVGDQDVANKLLDLVANLGAGNGTRLAQQALVIFFPGQGIAIDGVFGSKTCELVNRCIPDALLAELRARQARRYCEDLQKNPAEAPNAMGFFRRAVK